MNLCPSFFSVFVHDHFFAHLSFYWGHIFFFVSCFLFAFSPIFPSFPVFFFLFSHAYFFGSKFSLNLVKGEQWPVFWTKPGVQGEHKDNYNKIIINVKTLMKRQHHGLSNP